MYSTKRITEKFHHITMEDYSSQTCAWYAYDKNLNKDSKNQTEKHLCRRKHWNAKIDCQATQCALLAGRPSGWSVTFHNCTWNGVSSKVQPKLPMLPMFFQSDQDKSPLNPLTNWELGTLRHKWAHMTFRSQENRSCVEPNSNWPQS